MTDQMQDGDIFVYCAPEIHWMGIFFAREELDEKISEWKWNYCISWFKDGIYHTEETVDVDLMSRLLKRLEVIGNVQPLNDGEVKIVTLSKERHIL